MVYDYRFLKNLNNGRRRPTIPLRIINPHTKQSNIFACLLDTGADDSLFNYDLVKSLGHNLKGNGVESNVTSGIEGNDLSVWKHTFILELLHPKSSDVIWRSAEIQISCHEKSNVPNLLGTDTFLNNFTITFDYADESVRFHNI